MEKIIYTQTHPKPDIEEMMKEVEDVDLPEEGLPTFDELINRGERLHLEEIPGRRWKAQMFVEAAKTLCNDYEYNVVIKETSQGVVVELSLDVSQYTDCRLKCLIGMADDITLAKDVNDRDLTFFLRMSIFAVCRGSERIFPELLDS